MDEETAAKIGAKTGTVLGRAAPILLIALLGFFLGTGNFIFLLAFLALGIPAVYIWFRYRRGSA